MTRVHLHVKHGKGDVNGGKVDIVRGNIDMANVDLYGLHGTSIGSAYTCP